MGLVMNMRKKILKMCAVCIACVVGLAAMAATNQSVSASIGIDGARHLLNRTGFSATSDEIKSFASLNRNEAAEKLMSAINTAAVTPPPEWVNEAPPAPKKLQARTREEQQALQKLYNDRALELREWWFREMMTTPSPLTEKMTLFWHNHFATSQQKVRFTPFLYQQNIMLRRNSMGNFGTMLREVARDPAMLIYLDGANSRKEQPNENFAREVMELFTLGEGHYTEKDIKEAARAFTGWSVDRETGQFVFRRGIHDYGMKTVFNKSGNFEGDEIIDLLLAKPETAEFITRKLWQEFISPVPNEMEIKRMAVIFKNSGYNITKLMKTMLTSDAFYAPENHAALVKSPVEFVVGTLKTFDIQAPNMRTFVIASALLGQNVFTPPNVKGWPGGDVWINSATLLGRKQLLDRLFTNEDRLDVVMRNIDEMAMRNGDQPPAGREARMQRQLQKQMGTVNWNLDKWALNYQQAHGSSTLQDLTRVVLAIAPQAPLAPTENPSDWVRQLVADPAYQLK